MFDAVKHVSRMDGRCGAASGNRIRSVELKGRTLGVLGLGAIGQEVAKMASAFGMRVLAWSMSDYEARARECGAEPAEFDRVLRESDVLSLHLRASPQTSGIIGRAQLTMMPRGSVLVNTGRGALVDTEALIEALQSGHLGAAGLDVFTQEPLPLDSPLRELDNVVLLPHAAWVTEEASARLVIAPVDNILAYFAGFANQRREPGESQTLANAPGEIDQEHDRDGGQERMHVANLPAERLDRDVCDESKSDAVGDAVGEGHHHHRQQGRERQLEIGPIDLGRYLKH